MKFKYPTIITCTAVIFDINYHSIANNFIEIQWFLHSESNKPFFFQTNEYLLKCKNILCSKTDKFQLLIEKGEEKVAVRFSLKRHNTFQPLPPIFGLFGAFFSDTARHSTNTGQTYMNAFSGTANFRDKGEMKY